MLVSKILGDCLACGGKDCFGNVSVYCDHVLRGCRNKFSNRCTVTGTELQRSYRTTRALLLTTSSSVTSLGYFRCGGLYPPVTTSRRNTSRHQALAATCRAGSKQQTVSLFPAPSSQCSAAGFRASVPSCRSAGNAGKEYLPDRQTGYQRQYEQFVEQVNVEILSVHVQV